MFTHTLIFTALLGTGALHAAQLPSPADYPSNAQHEGKVGGIDIASHPAAAGLRQHLSHAIGKPANFAGHYTVTLWGTGYLNQRAALIDARNGKVYIAPFTPRLGCHHSLESRLLVVDSPLHIANDYAANGAKSLPARKEFRSQYWLWNEQRKTFTLLKEADPGAEAKRLFSIATTTEDASLEAGRAERPVLLTGTVALKVFPGRPNYESIAKGDEPKWVWILSCEELGRDLQLSIRDDAAGRITFFKQHTGSRIAVEGLLRRRVTANHHTEQLITVRSLEVAPKKTPARK